VIKIQPQHAVSFQVTVDAVKRNVVVVNSTTPTPLKPLGHAPSQIYTRDPPCVANALNIQLRLPGDREMQQIDNEVSLSATTLSLNDTGEYSDVLLDAPTDATEIEWRKDTLAMSKTRIREHLPLFLSSLVGIIEQFSCLWGPVDASKVSKDLERVSETMGHFLSAVRLSAALLHEASQHVPLLGLCRGIVEGVKRIFETLPKLGQPVYQMADHLVILEEIGFNAKALFEGTLSQRVDLAQEEEIAWTAGTVITGADSLIFNLVEKILGSLKDQPVPTKIITIGVSKVFIHVKVTNFSLF